MNAASFDLTQKSQPCVIQNCKRTSHVLCHGCQKNFCAEHLSEHDKSLNSQLNPLANDINALEYLYDSLNFEPIIKSSYEQLEKWRVHCHTAIDNFVQQKYLEIDRRLAHKVTKERDELARAQAKVTELIHQQQTTHEDINSLTLSVQNMKREINQLKQISFEIETHPLVLDGSVIRIKETFDLAFLPPVHKTIARSDGNWTLVAGNDRCILMHDALMLRLVDGESEPPKMTSWTHGPIYDMCWSSTLKRFIIINEDDIFLLNESLMKIERVYMIQKYNWFSCTCSETSLFLSTKEWNASIIECRLLPSIRFVKQWKSSPDICTYAEGIDAIVYNYYNGTLALLITNEIEKSVRFDLRSSTTLERLWALPLYIAYNQNKAFRFCSIIHNEWLIADHDKQRILQISEYGKIKSICDYHPAPCCVAIFRRNMLAVSTETVVNLHKL